jgi:hypothetical protein
MVRFFPFVFFLLECCTKRGLFEKIILEDNIVIASIQPHLFKSKFSQLLSVFPRKYCIFKEKKNEN